MKQLHHSISPPRLWKQQTGVVSDVTKLASDSFRRGWSPSKWTQSRFLDPWPHACGVSMGQLWVIASLSNAVPCVFFLSFFICLYWFTSGELPSAGVSSLRRWDGWKQHPPPLFKANTCGAPPTSSQFWLVSGKSSASEMSVIEFHTLCVKQQRRRRQNQ